MVMLLWFAIVSNDYAHKKVTYIPERDETIIAKVHHHCALVIQFSTPPTETYWSNSQHFQIQQFGADALTVKVIEASDVPMNIFARVGQEIVDILVVQTPPLGEAIRKLKIEFGALTGKKAFQVAPIESDDARAVEELLSAERLYNLKSFAVFRHSDRRFTVYQKPGAPAIEILEARRGKKPKKTSGMVHEITKEGPMIHIDLAPVEMGKKERQYLSVLLEQAQSPTILDVTP